ncbi:hypothetical protein QBC47DRAFT_460190 [Echria macrotheca]|uniref:Uncharacterized protein n=1 Tax=Echria macrotheca TaxID=438768 RepID=A0AAJ0BE66_9PEZI|nr:hypothetical protein QBC47DRAFT_460190 [Echria macrotheca]
MAGERPRSLPQGDIRRQHSGSNSLTPEMSGEMGSEMARVASLFHQFTPANRGQYLPGMEYELSSPLFSEETNLVLVSNGGGGSLTLEEVSGSTNEIKDDLEARWHRIQKTSAKDSKPPLFIIFGDGNGRQHPFSLTEELFQQVSTTCQLPEAFAPAVSYNNGIMTYFVEYEEGESEIPEALSIFILSPHAPYFDISAFLRVNIHTGATGGMVFGSEGRDIASYFPAAALSHGGILDSPFATLAFLLRYFGTRAECWRHAFDERVVKVEKATRATSDAILSPTDDPADDAKLASEVKQAHACGTDLMMLGFLLQFEVDLGGFFEKIFGEYENLRSRAGLEDYHGPRARDAFKQQLALLRSMGRSREQQTLVLRSRLQGQTNLLYSLISQRDTRIGLTIAEQSREIAEQSKQAAFSANQESKTVRTIAVMTLVFLPTTLIATIFSTGVFDLSDRSGDASGNVVAPLWWVFVLVSLVFTGLVVLIWWIWNRRTSQGLLGERGDSSIALQDLEV